MEGQNQYAMPKPIAKSNSYRPDDPPVVLLVVVGAAVKERRQPAPSRKYDSHLITPAALQVEPPLNQRLEQPERFCAALGYRISQRIGAHASAPSATPINMP